MFILKSIKKFIKYNRKIIFQNKNNNNLLVVDRSLKDQIIRNSIISSIINREHKLNIIILTDKKINDWTNLVYKSFGINKFIRVFDAKLYFIYFILIFLTLYETFLAMIKIKKKAFLWFINKHTIKNIDIGELIYDEYIRHDKSFLNPKLIADVNRKIAHK